LKNDIILIIASLLILVVVIIAVFARKNNEEQVSTPDVTNIEEVVKVLDDGTKVNISTELSKTKKVKGLEISNIQLTTNPEGVCVLLADVKNNTGKDTKRIDITITLLDKTGKEIQKIPGVVSPMKVGETVQLNSAVSADFTNAYDFKVSID